MHRNIRIRKLLKLAVFIPTLFLINFYSSRIIDNDLISIVTTGIIYLLLSQIWEYASARVVAPPEALSWIEKSKLQRPFAANRFRSKEEAKGFVKTLYSMGATRVNVVNIETMNNEPYSESLEVMLPNNSSQKRKLIALYAKEMLREFGPQEFPKAVEEEKGPLLFWWD